MIPLLVGKSALIRRPRILAGVVRCFETEMDIPEELKKFIPPPLEDYPPDLLIRKKRPAEFEHPEEEKFEVSLEAEGDLPAVSLHTKNIKFEQRTYVHTGKWMPVPEAHHIGEYKIKARVKMEHFELNDEMAERRLAYMLGPRYNPHKKIATVICSKFRSRVENKRYLVYQLLQLKRAAIPPDPEFDSGYEREQAELAEKKANWFNH